MISILGLHWRKMNSTLKDLRILLCLFNILYISTENLHKTLPISGVKLPN